jgi:N-methylhydantoinase A/oxoprolinase/acetone carboxylase beta subunit
MTSAEAIIGVDIGGTFTDFCLLDRSTGQVRFGKRLTTPAAPGEAVLGGVDELDAAGLVDLTLLPNVAHATTLVTNAIIERKGAPTGLLLTRGHLDILTIGREARYDHFNLRQRRPEPVVPRRLTREIDERLTVDGSVVRPLDMVGARAAVAELVSDGVEALAICFLHAYRNPAHERAVKEMVEAEFPGLDCSVSSEVAPEIREFVRASTTAANAYVRPIVRDYLGSLEQELVDRGFEGSLHVMLSSGGIATAADAARFPIRSVESGPAAGVLAAAQYGKQVGVDNLVAFDMGGTTAKVCFLENGRAQRSNYFEAGRLERFQPGSGLPLAIPVLELIEIGAGGGSIAHTDQLGLLKVGPSSAGASPGPAAYGRGGELPTVTDADLVLGYLDPHGFLGGEMVLDVERARAAIETEVAEPLGLSVEEAALGVFEIVNESMAAAAKLYAAERGLDPRNFTMIAFGGAGPIHAHRVAESLNVSRIIYPYGAGVASAVGLCIAAPAVEVSRSLLANLDLLDEELAADLLTELEDTAVAQVTAAGADPAEVIVTRSVDMRYRGQGYEVEVPLGEIDLTRDGRAALREAFLTTYAQSFGWAPDSESLEVVTWHLRASGPDRPHRLVPHRPEPEPGAVSLKGLRPITLRAGQEPISCPVYDRYLLAPGDAITGPALVEERETTVVVATGSKLEVDEHLNLVVTI